MDKIINELKEKVNKKVLTFSENYFKSSDDKTVMGELPFKEILFLEYRETEAGSNPREYIGLRKTNERILQSLFRDYRNMFRFLHSGIILSLVTPTFVDDKVIQYEDCCLTNGNQTRFIILMITLIKLISGGGELSEFTRKDYQAFVDKHFNDIEAIKNIIKYAKFNKLNEIVYYLKKNGKYQEAFNKMDLTDFLNAKIRVQVNVINSIIGGLDEELDSYSAGTMIAEANNDTQNVKVDDIFGNKYKEELNKTIFLTFNNMYRDTVQIEFRFREIAEKGTKIHILTLLRPVIATGIMTKESDVFQLTNQRTPIYRLFEKLLRKDNVNNTISAISKLIPLLYKIRIEYVEPCLKDLNRKLIRKYKEKAVEGSLDKTRIAQEILKCIRNNDELEKLIKRNVNYNIEHIMPVLVFKIRNLFVERADGTLDINLPETERSAFFTALIEAIYNKYVEMKLDGLPTSLTTVLRGKKFYEFGDEAYIACKNIYTFEETDYIAKNTHRMR